MKFTKITFIGYAEKKFFIRENAIGQSEIAAETQGSITLIESQTAKSTDWLKNGYVYSVEEVK